MLVEKDSDKITVPQIILVSIFFVFVVSYSVYKIVIVNTSGVRYTTCDITNYFNDSKSFGKTVIYYVNSKKVEVNCISDDCKKSKIGQRYVLKYYTDDPIFYEIYFDKPVSDTLIPPENGWEEIPKELLK